MALINKGEDTQTATFANTVSAVQTRIAAIKKMTDPAEQLLQYKTLKDSAEGAYDESKASKTYRTKTLSGREYAMEKAADTGFVNGLGLGFLGLCVAVAICTAGTVLPLLGAVAVFFVGSAVLGDIIGEKFGLRKFNKHSSTEEKHAGEMFEITRGLNKTIEELTGSLKENENMKTLTQSPHLEAVKKAFPEIATEFNRQAQIAAQQQKLLKVAAATLPTKQAALSASV